MGSRDPRVDAYVERAARFASPILRHLREVVPDDGRSRNWKYERC